MKTFSYKLDVTVWTIIAIVLLAAGDPLLGLIVMAWAGYLAYTHKPWSEK